MKFDIVIGNPPYNNDIYIEFMRISHSLSSDYSIMIVPAKFYFNNIVNEEVFDTLYRYFDKCVFYQCEGEIFKINMASGIVYYLADKNIKDYLSVKNVSYTFSSFNNSEWIILDKLLRTLNTNALSILNKIKDTSYNIECNNIHKKYKCNIRKQAYVLGGSSNNARGIFYYDNKFDSGWVTNNFKIQEDIVDSNGKITVFSSDNISECESFISYINTRFIRYLIAIGVSGFGNIMCDNAFRFVPEVKEFKHIFTDKELYDKYGLTQQEINIIEEVVKERK